MNDNLWGALGTVLTAVLLLIAHSIQSFLSSKKMNDGVKTALGLTADATFAAVKQTAQVYVDELRKASADGSLTAEEKQMARQKAIATAKASLGAQGVALISKYLGLDAEALQEFLGIHVEAAVSDLKASAPPAGLSASPENPAAPVAITDAPQATEAASAEPGTVQHA